MGLLDFFMGIQDPVEGHYRITSATSPSGSSPFTSIDTWPRPVDMLPVLFDRDSPDFLRIEWEQVPERSA